MAVVFFAGLNLNSWGLDLDGGFITLEVAGSGVQFSGINCPSFTITNERYIQNNDLL